jgi:hypothetical protein
MESPLTISHNGSVDRGERLYKNKAEYQGEAVKAGLVDSAEQYPYCYSYLAKKKAQGLKSLRENSPIVSSLRDSIC